MPLIQISTVIQQCSKENNSWNFLFSPTHSPHPVQSVHYHKVSWHLFLKPHMLSLSPPQYVPVIYVLYELQRGKKRLIFIVGFCCLIKRNKNVIEFHASGLLLAFWLPSVSETAWTVSGGRLMGKKSARKQGCFHHGFFLPFLEWIVGVAWSWNDQPDLTFVCANIEEDLPLSVISIPNTNGSVF